VLSTQLSASWLPFTTPQGAYYVMVDISGFGAKDDTSMTPWPGLAPLGRFVETGTRRQMVFVFDSGSQRRTPCLVLVHGLGDEADTWRHLFPLLARNNRVIALDLPGFGRSPSAGRTNLMRCAHAVVSLVRDYAAQPAILVGSSVGAVIAQLAAIQDPRNVRALVCIDGGLPLPPAILTTMLPMILPFSGERIYTAFRSDHDAAYASLNPYYSDFDSLPQADRDFLRSRVIDRVQSDTQRRAYFALLRSLVLWNTLRRGWLRRKARTFATPVLLAWGSDDRIIPRAAMDAIAAAVPHAQRRLILGAGHLPQQERPAELAESIDGFVSSL
jgi:pimeloyl-ACP methyl ester carboxylesterase